MIQRIDIKNFGSFRNFEWKTQIRRDGNIADLMRLNILYGRNYSGKTTLSRLIRCLETGQLPPKYDNPDFGIKTDTGIITQAKIGSHSHHVRVFNKDFVDEHLSFLRDDSGEIKPFAVLGGDNTKTEQQIAEKEKNLGSLESRVGLRFDLSEKNAKWQEGSAAVNAATSDRLQKLRNKASQDIKQNSHLYGDVNYDIRKIESDIATIHKNGVSDLSESEEEELKKLLKQDALPAVETMPALGLSLIAYYGEASKILSKEIKPSKPIQDLLDDALLQAWAKDGIPLHRHKRQSCGFCGNPIPADLWEKIDQHFSKESLDLDADIARLVAEIGQETKRAAELLTIQKSDLYPSLHREFQEVKADIDLQTKAYARELDKISSELRARQSDPFKTRNLNEFGNAQTKLEDSLSKLSPLVEQHLQKTAGLASDQASAKTRLRLSAIKSFVTVIDLAKIDSEIARLSSEANMLESEAGASKIMVTNEEAAIENLRKQLRDERRGAEKVNDILSHYFGNDSLKLVAVEEEEGEMKGVRFEIQRGDSKAYNLSDGECSLIAFCYFMAKLQDAESEGKELIVYIDDPISSLDSDHVFFVFSLIQSLIASPIDDGSGNKIFRYKQLFISTHNLEFLKFLKRLLRPKPGGNEHFLLVRTKNGSLLELMPKYLREYVTEFHYLFDQVCSCTDAAKISGDHHCFFNFGNNLRKFLEVYLFFRFPQCESADSDQKGRIAKFLADDPVSDPLVQRLTNELSHVGEIFDRSVQPLDHAEVPKMARFILGKIKSNDSDQYDALLQATGQTDPLATT